ncbi:MAG: hypothetical protein ACQZ2J_27710 [Pseudomonas piscis]|uniref:hypothetical protein n=1 Tax=Pseudomonas piscis TaxID=2614538 RepID=UPI003D28BF82
MPTETQHLEQRVAALQSDLNARDQALDDAATENNERELSRRDWFEEAQRLEKECEGLREQRNNASRLAIEKSQEAKAYRSKLVERDALLHELKNAAADFADEAHCQTPHAALASTHLHTIITKVEALSTSAEPARHVNRLCHIDYTAHPYRCGCLKGDKEAQRIYDEHCKLVERDDRVEFEQAFEEEFEIKPLYTRPGALPDTGTSSDKYKAELYDEVWQLARDMGFGNVTDALMQLKKQSAPTAVVLPERYDESQHRGTSLLAVRRWNACIDEVARLNPTQQ